MGWPLTPWTLINPLRCTFTSETSNVPPPRSDELKSQLNLNKRKATSTVDDNCEIVLAESLHFLPEQIEICRDGEIHKMAITGDEIRLTRKAAGSRFTDGACDGHVLNFACRKIREKEI